LDVARSFVGVFELRALTEVLFVLWGAVAGFQRSLDDDWTMDAAKKESFKGQAVAVENE
jgi:hypothetical protein